MNIGIDIDDTIANTWEYLMPFFSEKFSIPLNKIKTSQPYYDAVKDKVNPTDFLRIIRENENILLEVPVKENVREILTKLKQEGNNIIFITARGYDWYSNPYQLSKEYLDKLSIPYDKIITDARKKDLVCKEEKIDIFIDDNYRNCKDVSKTGIDVLMMEASFNINDKEFIHMKDWNQIYEYIKNR